MRQKLVKALLVLLLLSAWTDDVVAAVAPRLLAPDLSSETDAVLLAPRYREQILEKIQGPMLTSSNLAGAGFPPVASNPAVHLAELSPLAICSKEQLHVLQSLQC
jgi:hypothetical protein